MTRTEIKLVLDDFTGADESPLKLELIEPKRKGANGHLILSMRNGTPIFGRIGPLEKLEANAAFLLKHGGLNAYFKRTTPNANS